MEESELQRCGRVGMNTGLICATLGVLTALTILTALDLMRLVTQTGTEITIGIFAGLMALYVSAALMGRFAGRAVSYCGNNTALNLLIGILLALVSFAFASVAGFCAGFVAATRNSSVVLSDMPFGFAAFFSLMLGFGIIPAFFLGLLYGVLIKWRLIKIVSQKRKLQELLS